MRPISTLALVAGLLLPLTSVAQQSAGARRHRRASDARRAATQGGNRRATAGDLTISGAVARASIGNAPTSAVYMTITTAGAPDRLVGVQSPAAQAVELHASLQEGGVSKMQPIDGIPVDRRRAGHARARRLPRHADRPARSRSTTARPCR